MSYKQVVRGACELCALTAVAALAAENYPARPVRVVVPFGAGGPDLIARIVAQQLASQLGQPVVVDNRPGANGIVGTDTVAKAAPDGHTLILVSASFVVNPSIYKKLPYETLKDFAESAGEGQYQAMVKRWIEERLRHEAGRLSRV